MRTLRWTHLFSAALGVLLLGGCTSPRGTGDDDSSDDDDASNDDDVANDDDAAWEADCDTPACGGDVLGDWHLDGYCFQTDEADPFNGLCDDGTWESDGDGGSVMFTFESSGDYSFTTAASTENVTITVPTSCLPDLGASATCADLEANYLGFTTDPSCSDTPEGCECTAAVANGESTTTGLWSSDGSVLTLSVYSPIEVGFCVNGDTMNWVRDEPVGGFGAVLSRP